MQVEIEKMGFGGVGIGHLNDGRVVFVKKTVPGDLIDTNLTDQKKDYAFGIISHVIKPSKIHIDPPCQYFFQCGGCDHQNINYENQLKIKEELIRETLTRQKINVTAEPIIAGSDEIFYYRNSIRYMFLLDRNKHIYFARHNYQNNNKLVIIDKCMLQSEKSNLILEKLQTYINNNVEYKTSFWQLKIREGKNTNEIMVEIITSDNDLPQEKGIIKVLSQIQEVKSIYHTVAPAKSLLRLRRRLIFGSAVIYEKIGAYKFQISPESFFQPNSSATKNLYDLIKKYAEIEFGDEIVDLFCGTGSIGIYLSTLVKKVTGIEIVPEAIRDARDNAKINKITNTEFICSDATDIDIKLLSNKIIILDPPRAGLKKNLITKLAKAKFKRIIYVSCNPSTFARDLKLFMEKGIVAKKIQPIDMFPQTHHIELVAELTR